MFQIFYDHLDIVLCVLILISRVGDIGTTYLVSPNLLLEANPVARRLGWKFALLTLLVAGVPFFSLQAGILVLVPSLLVSASNASKIWMARAYGEKEYRELMLQAARRSKLAFALGTVWGVAGIFALTGAVLLFFCPDERSGGFWFAWGILLYALVIVIHGSLGVIRIFKLARKDGAVLAGSP
jgi:hypothetical protein